MKAKRHLLRWFAILLAGGALLPGQDSGGNPFAQSKFVPDISLILDCAYLHRGLDDAAYFNLSLPGFSHAAGNGRAAELGGTNLEQGFNLNYAELSLASVVDPYFDLFAVLHFTEEGVSIEEAYFATRRLPAGLQVKGGRFLSHFGRINGQHDHYWDFASPPLVQSVFFGGNLAELGARLAWVAPLDIFLQLGVEVLQGGNEMSFGRRGFAAGAFSVADVRAPGLVVATAKTSFDLGNLTVLAGLSNAAGRSRQEPGLEGGGAAGAFAGNADVYGADLTLKYLFDSIRYLSFQAEAIGRASHGDRYLEASNESWTRLDERMRQAGMYAQLVGRLNKRLRLGARLDLIWKNIVRLAGDRQALPEDLARYTAMAEWNPTEFSRLRLQYAYDRSRCEEIGGRWERRPFDELALQVNITIGAHGAHAF
ncbi:MAG TPA: hypothetical protein PK919_08895 [Candidatus Aminicenantes bacterium]|nr:hypothetical protein [Candidatus Aminicenantes bacterium]